MPACQLCSRDTAALEDAHGLQTCELCRDGDMGARLSTFGAELDVSTWDVEMEPPNRPAYTIHHFRVTASGGEAGPKQARFTREGLGNKVTKIFFDELQAGERHFDDTVFVETTDRRGTAALLKIPGVRSAIVTMVKLGGGVELAPGKVDFHRQGRAPLEGEAAAAGTLAACAVLRHMIAPPEA